jgi:acyl-CoA synthetase (AMP-forming)/AMP-acid ligase II
MSVSTATSTLVDVVRNQAQALGSATAYEFEGRITSFAEFHIKTNKVANALRALGIKPGERICYFGKNSDVYFELLVGAMKANVVMAPVNWRLAGPEVAFIVEQGPCLVCRSRIHHDGQKHPRSAAECPAHHHDRGRCAGMAGLHRLARRTERG